MIAAQVLRLRAILQRARRSSMANNLMNAQGEDVVAGIRTPQPISSLHETMPRSV